MKNLKMVMFVLTFAFVFVASGIAIAATSPSLGSASTYGVLGSTYTNTSAGTTINGDVGFTTGPAVAPLGTHTNYGSGAPYATAGGNQGSALSALASQACTFTFAPGAINLSTDTTHGTAGIYAPGVYCSTGAMNVGGPLSLSGSGTYIFRPAGALTSTAGATVTLAGASACDVFWTPTQATTLAAKTTFVGNIIDNSGITVGANTTLNGRALAFGGTVTTDTDTITAPTCGAVPPPVVPPVTPPALVPPLISITKVPTLLSLLPAGGGSVAFDYAVSNPGTVAMSNITAVDNKCSPVSYLSGDTNNNALLEVSETWHYRCTTDITQTTTNIATATGQANGFTATATATANVVVNAAAVVVVTPPVVIAPPVITPVVIPILPRTGFPPQEKSASWNIIIPAGIFGVILSFYLARRKQTN